MEEASKTFEDFSVEMGEFEVRKTGKFDRMWKTEQGGSIASGVVLSDGLLYVASANYNVYCLRPEDGSEVWKFHTEGVIVEAQPTVAHGIVYVASYDRNVYALDAKTGTLIWKFATSDKIASTVVASDGMVYVGGKDHNVYALDAKTGALMWKFRTYDSIISEGLVAGEKLFIGSYDHNLYCIDKMTGSLVWKVQTQGEIHNTNGFAHRDGVVYFGSFDNYTRAVDIRTGRLIWKTKCGNYGMGCAPVLYGDRIYQATRGGELYVLDLKGKLLWKYTGSEEDVMGIPCFHNGLLYLPSAGDWCMHCFNLNGRELWRFKTEGLLYERSVMVGDNLIFPSWDCNVYCIDVNTRRVVWKFRAPGSPAYVPPPYEAFELRMKIPKGESGGDDRKQYDVNISEEGEEAGSFYKSRITYQVSTQYRQKGKYQVDSGEEAL
jgi:outer membrane protein assembly factor BamB